MRMHIVKPVMLWIIVLFLETFFLVRAFHATTVQNKFRMKTTVSESLFGQLETPRKFGKVERTESNISNKLVSPSDLQMDEKIHDDDVQRLYEDSVQKTYKRYPLTIVKGQGCKLFDKDGNIYLDFVAGVATCALGHSNAELTHAITKQMNNIHHVSNMYYIPQQAMLAKWICANTKMADQVFFCNSGAEANEAAIKLARRHSSSRGITDPIIITAHNGFHGRTMATLSATAQPKYHQGFTYGGAMVPGFEYVAFNDEKDLETKVMQMNETPKDLQCLGRKRGVAAIMLEPIQGEGGVIVANPIFLQKARHLCNDCDALLIYDEIQSGMGRTGTLWAHQQQQHYSNVDPDVLTSAKALGGGIPIGAMMMKQTDSMNNKIKDSMFGPGSHGSTFGGNPLACAAGLAVAQYMSDHCILDNVKERGKELMVGLKQLQKKYGHVIKEVRGKGLLVGMELFSANYESATKANDVIVRAMKKGLLLAPAGEYVIRWIPPLVVSAEEVTSALEILDDVLSTVVGEE